jgi:hypothetical protein
MEKEPQEISKTINSFFQFGSIESATEKLNEILSAKPSAKEVREQQHREISEIYSKLLKSTGDPRQK